MIEASRRRSTWVVFPSMVATPYPPASCDAGTAAAVLRSAPGRHASGAPARDPRCARFRRCSRSRCGSRHGVNRTRVTSPRCPRSTSGAGRAVDLRRGRCRRGSPSRRESLLGLNATAVTGAGMTDERADERRRSAFQSRPVPSLLPVAMNFPSGLNATATTWPWCPRITFKGWPVCRGPEAKCPVAVTGGDHLAVGAPRDRLDPPRGRSFPAMRRRPPGGPGIGAVSETRRTSRIREASIAWLSRSCV